MCGPKWHETGADYGTVVLRGRLRGNVGLISITNLIQGLHQNMVQVVLQPFVLSLYNSATFLGILQSLGTRLGGLSGAAVQPIGGRLADRSGRRPVIVLASILNLAWFLLLAIAGLSGMWELLIPAFVLQGAALIRFPAVQATVAESVPMEGRGTAFSTTIFFLILPGAGMALVGGLMADAAGPMPVGAIPIYVIAMVLEGLVLLMLVKFLRETLSAPGTGQRRWLQLLTLPKGLRGYYVAMASDAFAWGLGSMLLYGFLAKAYGFTNTDLGVIAAVWSLSFALGVLPMGRLIHRFGCKTMMIWSEIIGMAAVAIWIFARDPWLFVVASVPGGLTAATWAPVQQTYLSNAVPMEERATVTGSMAAFRGLLSFPAPFIGGLLFDRYGGMQVPMVANLIGAIVATLLIALLMVDVPTRLPAPAGVATGAKGR